MNIKRGQQAEIARRIGITPKHLSDIFCRRAAPSRRVAELLEQELGVEAAAWLWPDKHDNPYIKQVQP